MVTDFIETLLMCTGLHFENFLKTDGPGIATDGHRVCLKIIDVSNFVKVHGPGIVTDGHRLYRNIIDVYKFTF